MNQISDVVELVTEDTTNHQIISITKFVDFKRDNFVEFVIAIIIN